MSNRSLSFKTTAAPPIETGGYTVTPVARALVLNWGRGAAVRAWPCSVLVSRDGRTSRRRIPNITHLIQAVILGGALLAVWRLRHQSTHRKGSLR